MGWNFGCAMIDFDFHSVVDTLLEPERRRFVTGGETPEERRQKDDSQNFTMSSHPSFPTPQRCLVALNFLSPQGNSRI